MSEKDNGGPAFPIADFDHQVFEPKTVAEAKQLLSGMTLRDYFAAKAMQGRLAIPGYVDCAVDAEFAYKMADAMLKARGN